MKVAHEQLHLLPNEGKFDSIKLLMEIEELMLEVENSKNLVEFTSSDMHEVIKCFSALAGEVTDFRSLVLQLSVKIKTVTSNYEKTKLFLEHKVSGLEDEKISLFNHS